MLFAMHPGSTRDFGRMHAVLNSGSDPNGPWKHEQIADSFVFPEQPFNVCIAVIAFAGTRPTDRSSYSVIRTLGFRATRIFE